MRSGFFFSLFVMIVVSASAQRAYWVTESNINVRGFTIVRVYDLDNQLITEKKIHRKVDITRKQEQRMLDRIVKTSVREQATLARKARRHSKEIHTATRGRS